MPILNVGVYQVGTIIPVFQILEANTAVDNDNILICAV